MVLVCLYNLIMNVGRMWGECGEECEDECGDQCGGSFTVVVNSILRWLTFKLEKRIQKSYSPELVIYRRKEHENLYDICENKKKL